MSQAQEWAPGDPWAAAGPVRGQTASTGAATDGLEGLEILVEGLFDYAGMFPPATLELDAALGEAARAPRLRRPHILGADLVTSVDDLERLDEDRLRMAGFGDTEVRACVVGVPGQAIDDAVVAVARRNRDLAGVLRVVSLEAQGTTFPGSALRTAAKALPGVQVFIEPRMPDAAWARNAPAILRLLRQLKPEARVGLKVRCSGADAIQAATLGWLLPRLVALGNPLKATAGLHHPLPEARYGNALGFVGLAAALRLRQALGDGMPMEAVAKCLTEQDPAAFSFDGELAWHGHAITVERLREAKRDLPFSIGSCSLREPDEDLARLFS